MTTWRDRAEAVKQRRIARGAATSNSAIGVLVRDAVENAPAYEPNRGFDYAEDVKAFPFAWRPTEPVRVSLSIPGVCRCGEPVRVLNSGPAGRRIPGSLARPRLCSGCAKPDDAELDLSDLIRRCKPRAERKLLGGACVEDDFGYRRVGGRWETVDVTTGEVLGDAEPEGVDPLGAAVRHLPGLGDALDAPQIPKPKPRRGYTISQKREAVRLYRETDLTMAQVAEKLDVFPATVRQWVQRYSGDAYFAS